MSAPTSVYRYLDADGVLIYVGITNRGVQRQAEHVVHSKWWRFVRAQDVEHYDDRDTAERRERYLIEKHQPPFNVTHNADHKRRLAAYLKHANPTSEPCGHCYGCQMAASDDPDIAASQDAVCRLLLELGEDEEPTICPICKRAECAYQDGIDEGNQEGYRQGWHQGERRAWREAHEQYAPTHLAELSLRLVIDGDPRLRSEGFWCLGRQDAEDSLRDLQRAIDEHGVTALVDQAAARDPWMVS